MFIGLYMFSSKWDESNESDIRQKDRNTNYKVKRQEGRYLKHI